MFKYNTFATTQYMLHWLKTLFDVGGTQLHIKSKMSVQKTILPVVRLKNASVSYNACTKIYKHNDLKFVCLKVHLCNFHLEIFLIYISCVYI